MYNSDLFIALSNNDRYQKNKKNQVIKTKCKYFSDTIVK